MGLVTYHYHFIDHWQFQALLSLSQHLMYEFHNLHQITILKYGLGFCFRELLLALSFLLLILLTWVSFNNISKISFWQKYNGLMILLPIWGEKNFTTEMWFLCTLVQWNRVSIVFYFFILYRQQNYNYVVYFFYPQIT